MDIHGISAHVLVNGRKVKEYRHNGLTFIEAKEGTEFSIEVKNHLGARVLAIVSIDGLDIIEGKPATAKSKGYIVGANSCETFNGWRVNDNQVGAFKFTTSDKSYATERGVGQNNGVIAIKLIEEKCAPVPQFNNYLPFSTVPKNPNRPHWIPSDPYYVSGVNPLLRGYVDPESCVSDVQKCMSPSDIQWGVSQDSVSTYSFDMGTTWGAAKEEKVTYSTFEYGNEIATLEFFYASRDALKTMGIPLVALREVGALPQAFADQLRYAQPPKNWNK